jgi:Secretion system C-terminal sorting domain
MKKITYIFAFVLVLALSLGFLKVSQGDPNADASPVVQTESINNLNQLDTNPATGWPFTTLFNFNYASVPNMNAGTVGAMVLFNKFYFNRWNLTFTYRYTNTGPNGGPGTLISPDLTYVGSVRDLTTDGRYLYGGNATATLYKFDTNMALIWTRSLAGGSTRAITWDPNRKGFWNTNFGGNIFCHDTNGVLIQTIVSTQTGKYGMGWDSTLSVDTAWVWVWDQNTPPSCRLNKYHAASGQQKATYTVNLTGAAVGIPGGAEVLAYNNNLTLLLNYQNFALVGYKMKDLIVGLGNTNNAVRDFKLGQNYPNPFNPSTKISFTLTYAGDVVLDVYDVNGKLVRNLINGYMNAGDREYTFDASGLSSGTYFYKITANGYSETKKMLLVK